MHSLGVPIEEMYRVFNMGIGFIVVVKAEDKEKTINTIEKYNHTYLIGRAKEDSREKVTIKTFQEGIITL